MDTARDSDGGGTLPETPSEHVTGTEEELEEQRQQIVEAIDWIDAERKRLSRHCFAETRKKWHGERERGRQITLMKKESEWLYRQRCQLRERIGCVNTALKETRKARRGTVSESFGSVFVDVARETLPQEVFASVLEETTRRYGAPEGPPREERGQDEAVTVLEDLKRRRAAFVESNNHDSSEQPHQHAPRTPRGAPARSRRPKRPRRESQADFGLSDPSGNSKIFSGRGYSA